MADNADNGSPGQPGLEQPQGPTEHLNIKVTDNNNEVFFKIKRSTKLEKLMTAFCERQGKTPASVRFLFEGQRVQPTDTPDTVSWLFSLSSLRILSSLFLCTETEVADEGRLDQLEMQDGDTLEVHQEQVGGW